MATGLLGKHGLNVQRSKYCFKGSAKRIRTCSSPAPNKGGDDCVGISEQIKVCPTERCTGKYVLYTL